MPGERPDPEPGREQLRHEPAADVARDAGHQCEPALAGRQAFHANFAVGGCGGEIGHGAAGGRRGGVGHRSSLPARPGRRTPCPGGPLR